VLEPGTEADDGLFELVPITGRRDFTTKALTTFRHSPVSDDDLRNLGFDRAAALPGARFSLRVRADDGQPTPAAQADGEEIPAGDRYQIDVMPRCLRLIVPREEITGAV
jgi:hypothetical protein